MEVEKFVFIGIALFLILVPVALWVGPQYNVWERELAGKAQLKQAEWNRQITIKEAQAELESAKLLAEAEVVRSEGIAQANIIIADSITEEYLKYRFIEALREGNGQVIYVPTEANLPILEATR